jgi:hypothetical protein
VTADVLTRTLRRHDFLAGLRLGSLALVVGLVAATSWRRIRPRPGHERSRRIPSIGLLLVGAVLVGLSRAEGRSAGLVAGLGLLALAGVVGDLVGEPMWAAALAVPGGWELAWHAGLLQAIHHHPPAEVGWIRYLTLAATVGGGVAIADFDHRYRASGWASVLVAVTVAGIYTTVPETNETLVVLGAAVALALLGWPLGLGSFGMVGAFPVAGLLAWTAAYEGLTRTGSIVASVGCLGLLLAEPAGRRLAARWHAVPSRVRVPGVTLVFVHAALVAWMSRVAGQKGRGPGLTAIWVAPALVAAAVGLALVSVGADASRVGRLVHGPTADDEAGPGDTQAPARRALEPPAPGDMAMGREVSPEADGT